MPAYHVARPAKPSQRARELSLENLGHLFACEDKQMELGYELIGSGPAKVIVMHDWFCDHTSYAPMFPYLNQKDFQFAFVDLRGYGLSKALTGAYTLDEATGDVLETADKLKWEKFHLIGYSMTGLVGQNMMAAAQQRVLDFTAICSVPADGYAAGAEDSVYSFLNAAALGDDIQALQIPAMMTSNKYDQSWAEFKVRRWRETSTAEARSGYLAMFVKSNILSKVKGLQTPLLVISASEDAEGLRKAVMQETFGKWYPTVEIVELTNSGHNPMQEIPASLATVINAFLAKHSAVSTKQSVAAR